MTLAGFYGDDLHPTICPWCGERDLLDDGRLEWLICPDGCGDIDREETERRLRDQAADVGGFGSGPPAGFRLADDERPVACPWCGEDDLADSPLGPSWVRCPECGDHDRQDTLDRLQDAERECY
jgi:RNA polymerase subunit RPABC4/transcription elongation factor Spt4